MRNLELLSKKPVEEITKRDIDWLVTLLAETIHSGPDTRIIKTLNRIIEACNHDQVFELVACIIDYKLKREDLGAIGLHVYKEKSYTMEFYFDAIPLVNLLSITIARKIIENDSITIFGICGESGSGKTEIARLIQHHLKRLFEIRILKQDNYFKLPPKANTEKRMHELEAWIGPQEVKLDLMAEHISAIKRGENIKIPVILDGDSFKEERIREEVFSVKGVDAVIVDGTYCGFLKDVLDFYIYLDVPYTTTERRRLERDRGRGDTVDREFLKKVLAIERKIILQQKKDADIIVDENYHIIYNKFAL